MTVSTAEKVHKLGRKKVPENESPNAKFVRLAVPRMTSFKARARMIKNLASYDFSVSQMERMLAEIDHSVTEIRSAFQRAISRGKNQDQFSFND